jgi:hypothetical protein
LLGSACFALTARLSDKLPAYRKLYNRQLVGRSYTAVFTESSDRVWPLCQPVNLPL